MAADWPPGLLAILARYKDDDIGAVEAWGDVVRLAEGIPQPEAPEPRVWRGRCVSHAAEEHVMVNTAGHWMCILALRPLDEGWAGLVAALDDIRKLAARAKPVMWWSGTRSEAAWTLDPAAVASLAREALEGGR